MGKRLYRHNRARYWYAYDLGEICALFSDTGLHVQTVRAWIKDGLKTIDGGKPTLIYGDDLIEFLKRHNEKGKCEISFDKFYCMKCHDERPALQGKVAVESKDRFLKASCRCRMCKTRMFKNYKLDDYQTLKRTFHVVDVLELYDCETPTVKTHLGAQFQSDPNESYQLGLFDA